MIKPTLLITLLFISFSSFSQKRIPVLKQKFEYNEQISFRIYKMNEYKGGNFGFRALRGYTSYLFNLEFENNTDSIVQGNLKEVYLANPKTKTRSEVLWYNIGKGVGSKTKPEFEIKPGKTKRFVLFFIYAQKDDIYFWTNGNLKLIKIVSTPNG